MRQLVPVLLPPTYKITLRRERPYVNDLSSSASCPNSTTEGNSTNTDSCPEVSQDELSASYDDFNSTVTSADDSNLTADTSDSSSDADIPSSIFIDATAIPTIASAISTSTIGVEGPELQNYRQPVPTGTVQTYRQRMASLIRRAYNRRQ